MTILSIGLASFEITCPVEDYPVEGNQYRLKEKIESGGGTASNVAYLLGKWGVDTYFAGVIGSDDYGTKIKKELEQALVKTEYIEYSYEVGTPLFINTVNKKQNTRTKLEIIGNNYPGLKKYEYGINPNVVFTDGHDYNASVNALNRFPSAISILDAERSERNLLELCKYVKYIVCSKNFAETVSGLKMDFNNSMSLVNVYKKLKNHYPNNEIIVTLGNMGAMYTINNEIKVMPGIKTNVVDPSGSSDTFHGAFAYALGSGFDLEKSITYANIAAGLSLTKMGGRTSFPTIKEVINYYNGKFSGQIQVEEAKPKIEEVKEEDALPEIPDAKTFQIPNPSAPVENSFSIGGQTVTAPSTTSNVQ